MSFKDCFLLHTQEKKPRSGGGEPSNPGLLVIFTKMETSKDFLSDHKTLLPVSTPIATILISEKRPLTLEEIKRICPNCEHLKILEDLNPTLIVPLIQKNHIRI